MWAESTSYHSISVVAADSSGNPPTRMSSKANELALKALKRTTLPTPDHGYERSHLQKAVRSPF